MQGDQRVRNQIPPRRPSSAFPCAAAAVLAFLLIIAPPAAFAKRSPVSKITGFDGASSIALNANGEAWITDAGQEGKTSPPGQPPNPGSNGLYEYGSYPTNPFLAMPSGFKPWEFYILDLQAAVDDSTEEVYVAQSNGRTVDIFAPESATNKCEEAKQVTENGTIVLKEPVCYTHSWTRINSANTCFNCTPTIHVAIDNTNTYSRGRIYLSLTSPEDDVEMVDSDQRPVDFPATASYITNNKLTGTPKGPFGAVSNVSVDSDGNVYVTDTEEGVVDEFESSGLFLRSFKTPNVRAGYPGAGGVAVDPTNGNVLVTESGQGVNEFDAFGNHLASITTAGGESFQPEGLPAATKEGYVYVPSGEDVNIFGPDAALANITYGAISGPTTSSATVNATIEPGTGGEVTTCQFEYGTTTAYGGGSLPCGPSAPPYTGNTAVKAELTGLTPGTTYHYRVVVKDPNGAKYGSDQTYTPSKVLNLQTGGASGISENSATVEGSLDGNGESTSYYFEWGPTESYGNTTSSPPGASAGSPSGETTLGAPLEGLQPDTTYHYRIVASNPGGTSQGQDMTFTTNPGVPIGRGPSATSVHSDRAVLHSEVDPNGANTTVQFEYVDNAEFESSGWQNAEAGPEQAIGIGMSKHFQSASGFVTGLKPGTLYHYRAAGTNEAGSGSGPEGTFTTFPFTPSFRDSCPNSHVRQQTGSSLLLDCRGYELVSAANTHGYDVESSLVPGQHPFGGYPEAVSPPDGARVLYGIHNGGLPGTGYPTNRGVDPYVATRGPEGWNTTYVGIPSNDPFSAGPFSSSLAEADPGLDTFAFGGEDICSPCFEGGSTGIPIHLPNGELVQGMAGSLNPGASAEPAGFIGKRLSADGSHVVFGSKSQFEPEGNSGEISIYDRNLRSGITHVVSKTPAGQTMKEEGKEIGELDISRDGSRIVFGKLVSEEEGARHWQLYMNIGDSGKSIELTPGASNGVVFDGMTADGSKIFFTTKDALSTASNQDTDHSADIYEAVVSGTGTVTLSRISTGAEGSGNTDSCDPSANTIRKHWNTTTSEENCGVVAVGGSGGVAAENGTIYFLSPERLDGSGKGVENAPNLYVARPGAAPEFVATLESSSNAPIPPAAHPYVRSFGHFQNPAGVAIDHKTGDVYVLDIGNTAGTGYLHKFDSAGHPLSFAGPSGAEIGGVYGLEKVPVGIAVNQTNGDIYVPELLEGQINILSPTGGHVGSFPASFPTAVAIDPATEDVYVASAFGEVSIFKPNGTAISGFETPFSFPSGPTGIAVDSTGKVYVVNGGGFAAGKGTTEMFESSGKVLGQLTSEPSYGVTVDPANNDVYVDQGSRVVEFDSSGNPIGAPTGEGILAKSLGLAAEGGVLDISNPGAGEVSTFGPAVTPPDIATDNPLVVDSVSSPEDRRTGDFEITPSGQDAVFPSSLSLTGYNTGGNREIYRYDTVSSSLECASCSPTSEQATGEASLPENGLGLTNDGRVFFNSFEGLVDRDLNEKEDAYEWEPKGYDFGHGATDCETQGGCVDLISSGTSSFPSSLLGVSANGLDAYFFTRDKLAQQDENGNTVKIYDARELGGFPYVPPEVQCKASDECHGPSSKAPAEPSIKSLAGSPIGNHLGNCIPGYVSKNGKCVKKKHRHHKRRHKVHRRRHKSRQHRHRILRRRG